MYIILLIHAMIKVDPCYQKVPQISIGGESLNGYIMWQLLARQKCQTT